MTSRILVDNGRNEYQHGVDLRGLHTGTDSGNVACWMNLALYMAQITRKRDDYDVSIRVRVALQKLFRDSLPWITRFFEIK